MDEVIRGFRVSGKVQGVYFRHSTRIEAQRLGVRGIARNLEDGTVQVFAQGKEAAVRALREWLQLGPAQARVDAVEDIQPDSDFAAQVPNNFEVR